MNGKEGADANSRDVGKYRGLCVEKLPIGDKNVDKERVACFKISNSQDELVRCELKNNTKILY